MQRVPVRFARFQVAYRKGIICRAPQTRFNLAPISSFLVLRSDFPFRCTVQDKLEVRVMGARNIAVVGSAYSAFAAFIATIAALSVPLNGIASRYRDRGQNNKALGLFQQALD